MTARYADRVALMSANGRMAETGDPRQLMSDEGSRLWALINKVGRHTLWSWVGANASPDGLLALRASLCYCPYMRLSIKGAFDLLICKRCNNQRMHTSNVSHLLQICLSSRKDCFLLAEKCVAKAASVLEIVLQHCRSV